MKKVLLTIALVGVLAFGSIANVDAMSKKDLKAKLTKAYTINGTTYQLTSDEKVLVERYLDENEVSSKDADYISSQIDEVVKTLSAGNAKSKSEFTKAEKDMIRKAVSNISANTSVKATLSNDGTLVVYDKDGKVFAEVNDSKVKQTSDNGVLLVAGAVSLLGIGLALTKLKRNA